MGKDERVSVSVSIQLKIGFNLFHSQTVWQKHRHAPSTKDCVAGKKMHRGVTKKQQTTEKNIYVYERSHQNLVECTVKCPWVVS